MAIKVDIRVPVGAPIPELVRFIERCEDAGFHGVGMHDHHHSGRDAYLTLALAALNTATLALYPMTSNPVTRHPLVLATLANSLAEVAPSRSMLTLAPGFLAVESAGRARATLEDMRDAVTAIRALLAGDLASIGGRDVRLRDASADPPPVLLTASGPRLLELAGEVADGAVMLVGLAPEAVEQARRHLSAGARKAGRDPRELQQVFIVSIDVGERERATRWPRTWFRDGRPWLAYPSASNFLWLEHAGIHLDRDVDPGDIDEETARRICDALGLFGPPEHCAERLSRAGEEAGIEHVFLFPAHDSTTSYELPVREVRAFREVIAPSL